MTGAVALIALGVSVAGATMAALLGHDDWNAVSVTHSAFAVLGGTVAATGVAHLRTNGHSTP